MTDAPVEVTASGQPQPEPTTDEADERLMTKQAADLIGVTLERMRTLASDGRVPAERVSYKWWFSRCELERMMAECPQVLYARRTPQIAQVTQARREKSRAAMLRLNATRTAEQRSALGSRGYYGLLAKIAREVDPANALEPGQREAIVQMRYRAQMAEVRAKKSGAQRTTQPPMTRDEVIAQADERARAQMAQEHSHDDGRDPLEICFQCWRENVGGRPPARLVNTLCEQHQKEHDEFAATLRATS